MDFPIRAECSLNLEMCHCWLQQEEVLVVSHADWESVSQSLTAQSHDPDKNGNQIIEQSLMGS